MCLLFAFHIVYLTSKLPPNNLCILFQVIVDFFLKFFIKLLWFVNFSRSAFYSYFIWLTKTTFPFAYSNIFRNYGYFIKSERFSYNRKKLNYIYRNQLSALTFSVKNRQRTRSVKERIRSFHAPNFFITLFRIEEEATLRTHTLISSPSFLFQFCPRR